MQELKQQLEAQFSSAPMLPPQNVEAEEAVLGGILLDPGAIARVADLLPPDAFYIAAHKEIYKAALALYHAGRPTDLLHLSTWVFDHHLSDKIGGNNKLAELVDRTVSAINIDRYAALLLDKWQRRRLIHAGNEIVQLGYDTSRELEEVTNESEQKVFALSRQSQNNTATSDLCDTIASCYGRIEQISSGQTAPGIPSGFYDLDAKTGGFGRGDLIVVAGRPAMGKTAFATGCARNVADKEPTLIFSLEMSKEQLGDRFLSTESGVPSERMRTGKLQDNDWAALSDALGTLASLPVVINDQSIITVAQMASIARQVSIDKGGLGMVLIDYVQLMGEGKDNRVQELSRITRQLKIMAKELKVPVILLSQLSREVETRTNKRPMMSDLRESGSIEQDADIVLMLYRDEYYNPNTPDRGIAELIIAKHRNGPTGTIKLLFDSEVTQFKNLAQKGF
jgi:replicative DNA helicase